MLYVAGPAKCPGYSYCSFQRVLYDCIQETTLGNSVLQAPGFCFLWSSFDPLIWASPVAQLVKNLPTMQETWVRSPGEGKGYPLQYSGLENSMDCIVHRITKSWT